MSGAQDAEPVVDRFVRSDGLTVDLDSCAEEPIRIPGAVQPFAAVVVADAAGTVRQASANATSVLGVAGGAAGGGPAVVGRTLADLGLPDPAALAAGPVELAIGAPGPAADRATLAVHARPLAGGWLVELEPVEAPTAAPLDFGRTVATALAAMQGTTGVDALLERVAVTVRTLIGYDRVMVYRFHPDGHGEVVAECRRDDLEPFLGLHYPESDIPRQARELYCENWIRSIPDAAYEPVLLEPMDCPLTGAPLDLSGVACRSVSPMHTTYLANMGVRASMSVSLLDHGRLWGLVACHHYDGPRAVPPGVRAMCELVGLSASTIIVEREAGARKDRQLERERRRTELVEAIAGSTDLRSGLASLPGHLLAVCDADGVVARIGGHEVRAGTAPDAAAVERLIDVLAADPSAAVTSTERIVDLVPGWTGAAETADAAGVLALPVSRAQRNYVLWFRREWRRTVTWAGNPDKVLAVDASGTRLLPRASFAAWSQEVHGAGRPWDAEDVESAERLRQAIGSFAISQAEQLARVNDELSRSNAELDAFAYAAAHDLQEPLRGVHNYAVFLAEDYEDVLDAEGREQLQALTRLTERMAVLLRTLLDYARVGRSDVEVRPVLISDLLVEARSQLSARLAERGARLTLERDGSVLGDDRLLVQVLVNLLANALKYSTRPAPDIRVSVLGLDETVRGPLLIRRSATEELERPVVAVDDDGIGVPPDRAEEVFEVFRRLHGREEYGGGSGAGLAIVRRIVERHGGRTWVEPSPLGGARFCFTAGVAARPPTGEPGADA